MRGVLCTALLFVTPLAAGQTVLGVWKGSAVIDPKKAPVALTPGSAKALKEDFARIKKSRFTLTLMPKNRYKAIIVGQTKVPQNEEGAWSHVGSKITLKRFKINGLKKAAPPQVINVDPSGAKLILFQNWLKVVFVR